MLLSGKTDEEGGHDWIYLLSNMGLLPRTQWLGGLTHKPGALVCCCHWGWAAWLLWRQHRRSNVPDS